MKFQVLDLLVSQSDSLVEVLVLDYLCVLLSEKPLLKFNSLSI